MVVVGDGHAGTVAGVLAGRSAGSQRVEGGQRHGHRAVVVQPAPFGQGAIVLVPVEPGAHGVGDRRQPARVVAVDGVARLGRGDAPSSTVAGRSRPVRTSSSTARSMFHWITRMPARCQ